MGLTETYTAIAPERITETDKIPMPLPHRKRADNLTMQWDPNPLTINDTAAQNQMLFTTA